MKVDLLRFLITNLIFTDQTTCECKPIVSTCSAMGTTGGILGQNGNLSNFLDIFSICKKFFSCNLKLFKSINYFYSRRNSIEGPSYSCASPKIYWIGLCCVCCVGNGAQCILHVNETKIRT